MSARPAVRPLPVNLFPAYEWTEAAGEIDELARLSGRRLATYCRASARNWRENPSGTEVTAGDLETLAAWLADDMPAVLPPIRCTAGERARISAAAKADGLTLSEYVRTRALGTRR